MKYIIIASFAALTMSSCGIGKIIHTTPAEDSIIHLIATDSNARIIAQMTIKELQAYLNANGVSYNTQATILDLLELAYAAYKSGMLSGLPKSSLPKAKFVR